MSWPFIVVTAAFMAGYCAAVWIFLRRRAPGERKALESAFEHQLLHDDLTKLPNRTLFRDRLERALARSVRRRQSCAVLSIDIDRFELVNDGLGPSAGDEVLRELAARLDGCVRPEDTVARTGGDEFMLLLESVGSAADTVAVADRVTEALGPPFQIGGRELFLSVSIGISAGHGGRDRPEDVLQNADVAVHRAKDNGGARFEVFRQEMSPHPLQRLGLETDLRRAVEQGEFFLEYQPTVELASGRMTGVEALVRWRHPDRGVLQPLEFLPIAEETGLSLRLGRWVLDDACRQAGAWAGRYTREAQLVLHVNLSARQFQLPRLRLADEVASVLAGSGLPPEVLCVEISEGAVMQDVETAEATMRDLKALGVRLALDDFGTGRSSLGSLRRFPLDVVKIDRSFVAELAPGRDGEGEAIVRALIEVCHALHATVLAEGTETAEQARLLKRMGCDLGQGECFSPPVAPAEVERLLESGRPLAPANTA
jgi:diguanylate cyclase (GGDEF)-like protein